MLMNQQMIDFTKLCKLMYVNSSVSSDWEYIIIHIISIITNVISLSTALLQSMFLIMLKIP